MKYRIIIFTFLLGGLSLKGQVFPPDFICIGNDSLMWELPNNSCGNFNAFEIFFSASPEGPFSLLATITNPSQTSFFHEDADGLEWHYYLQSDYDCPGEPILSSDTLNNRIPEVGPLSFVSVTGNDVEISWTASPSPEVFAYVISRNTNAGTTIIDTVFNGLTNYIDTTAAPDEQSEKYFVVALDPCGNTSLVADPHQTLFLSSTEADPCGRSISLNWNAYQNWTNGVGSHEIWVSVNGEPEQLTTTIGGDETTYVFENARDLDTYCFTVRAIQEGTSISSNSNQVCQTLDIIQPVVDFLLYNASFTPTNQVEVSWVWDPRAEITEIEILRSSDNNSFQSVISQVPSFPLQGDNSYADDIIDSGTGPLYYQIRTLDECNDEAVSNNISTLYLAGITQEGGTNSLNWSGLGQLEQVNVESYDLYRIVGGSSNLLANFSAETRNFMDQVDLANPDEATACYYLIANSTVTLPDSTTRNITTRSNQICLEQAAKVFLPNAFIPDGVNKEFRPVLQFGQAADYQMLIYDRWGKLLFESNSFDVGWNGKIDGKPMPQGVYAYYIRLVQSGGQIVEKRGNVLLLR